MMQSYFCDYYNILEKYSSIESDLQREFVNAYKKGDIETMAKCAKTLLPFKVCVY